MAKFKVGDRVIINDSWVAGDHPLFWQAGTVTNPTADLPNRVEVRLDKGHGWEVDEIQMPEDTLETLGQRSIWEETK